MKMNDLKAPEGWWLFNAHHQHTPVRYKGDEHTPITHPGGAWVVSFQCYTAGGLLTTGRGKTLEEAWGHSYRMAEEIDKEIIRRLPRTAEAGKIDPLIFRDWEIYINGNKHLVEMYDMDKKTAITYSDDDSGRSIPFTECEITFKRKTRS